MTAIEKHEAIYSVKLIYKSENSTFRERGGSLRTTAVLS